MSNCEGDMSYTQLHEPWAEEPYPTPLRAKRYGEEYVNNSPYAVCFEDF